MKVKYLMFFLWIFYIPSIQAFNIAQNICEYIAADDKKRLRSLLKDNRLKLRKLFPEISCNKDNILIFAARSNAYDVGALLVKKIPKKILKKNMAEIENISAEMTKLINDRIN